MEWYKNLFVGSKVAPEAGKIIRKIEEDKYTPGIYLVTLASNGIDQLDVVDTKMVIGRKNAYRRLPMIVGIASGSSEANAVVAEIARTVIVETGRFDIRTYLKEDQEKGA